MQTHHLEATRDLDVYAKLSTIGSHIALGLDFGTNCGVAVRIVHKKDGEQPTFGDLYLGQWLLDMGAHDGSPIRFFRLRAFLAALKPTVIFYENPKYTPAAIPGQNSPAAILARAIPAAQFLGSLRDTTTTWAYEYGIPTQSFDIGEIKKFATGKGNAGKPLMIAACNERYGTSYDTEDFSNGEDNIADAAHTLGLGLSIYTGGF